MYTGRDVKELRSRLNIPQKEMANIVGVSVYTIRYWEQRPNFQLKGKYELKLQPLLKDDLSVVNEENVRTNFFSKMKSSIAKITFVREAVVMYYGAIDPYTSNYSKVVALAALAYFINPIDLVPDFIPVTGFLDDAAMVMGAFVSLRSSIKERHEEKADEWLNNA